MSSVELLSPGTASAPVCDEPLYEIVGERRVELPPTSAYAGKIASDLLVELGLYVKSHGLGRAFVEMLYRIRSDPNLQRRPDLSFISFERWPKGKRTPLENAWEVVHDLVVELVSPTNLAEEIPTRIREYFEAGVRRAWVIYPHESLVYEYDSPRSIRVLGREDALEGRAVVPGFRLALADLFEGPEESVADPA
jgi:Uma2 family endonuclease